MATQAERNQGAGAYSTPGVETATKTQPDAIITGSPIVGFKVQHVDPPAALYVLSNYALRLFVWSSISNFTLTVEGRILRSDGVVSQFRHQIVPTGNRALNQFFFGLTEGFLLSVSVGGNTPGLTRGQVYCELALNISLGTNGIAVQELAAENITGACSLSWPTGRMISALEGPGNIRSVTGTTPAAGAEISEVVPTNARWRLIAARFTLIASAAVANRTTHIQVDDGVNPYWVSTFILTQTASSTVVFSATQGITPQADTGIFATLSWPAGLYMMPGHRWRTNTANLQAADQYSAPQYLLEEWLETT